MLGKDRPASPLPLYARSQTSCGIKSAVHLVALFLLFLLTICTYLRTSYTTPKPHPSRRTPGYEGPPLLDCPALSPEEASLDAALRALETEEPMWTRKIFQSDKRADRTGARRSWLELNPSHRFELLLDGQAEAFMNASMPTELAKVYRSLPLPILKADLLRYALLWREGGVWSDSDTICLRPIDEWHGDTIELDVSLHTVAGIEVDAALYLDPDWRLHGWVGPARGYQLVQWTLRSRRYSPAMRRTLVKAVTRLGQHGDQAYSLEDILLSTGPQLFTEAVLQTAACELDEAVGWRNISGTVAPRKLGGTLVLPRIAFNADSGIDEEKERFVKHLFASSWKEKSWWPF